VRGEAAHPEFAPSDFQNCAECANTVAAGRALESDLKNERGGADAVGFQRVLRWEDFFG
jgi:hypothetical protein